MPLLFSLSDSKPNAVLLLAVFKLNADDPDAVFELPDTFALSALYPAAELLVPALFN